MVQVFNLCIKTYLSNFVINCFSLLHRAYIDEVLENNMVKLFFLDYGTIAIVPHVDTRYNNEEEVWYIQPLAIPFFLKGLNLTKLKDFKNMQYCMFEIMTLKLIENVRIQHIKIYLS